METKHVLQTAVFALASAFSLQPSALVFAPPIGTAFTYQGRLNDGGNAATGSYDLRFTIYDAAAGGNAVGWPITNSPVGVTNGLFATTLDFGAVFDGTARWLELAVRPAVGGAFAPRSPRQALTAAPYANWAGSAASAQTAAVAGTLSGALPSSSLQGLYTSQLTFFNETNEFYGEFYGDVYGDHYGDSFGDFYGDGYGITHLNASQLWYGTMPDGRLSTNVAMLPANQVFSGSNLFTGALVATNASNVFQGTFTGDGAAISHLNGVALSPATVGNAALQTSAVTADKVASAQVVKSLNNLKDDVVLAAGENIVLTTNGNSLQVSASSLSTAWRLAGNMGTTPGTDFLGTSDNQPLEIKVNNKRVLRLEPTTNGSPNLIAGDVSNVLETGVNAAAIGGGNSNTIQVAANYSVVGGGGLNTIQSYAFSSVIAGGFKSTIQANANNASIGGGYNNSIETAAHHGTIAGGGNNAIQANAYGSTVGGGSLNTIQTNANNSTIAGGQMNTIQANARYVSIPGGYWNIAGGDYSFAAGYYAQATNKGSFVWADSSTTTRFSSTANDQFLVRATGGVGINKNNPTTALDVNGTVAASNFSGSGAGLTALDAGQLSGIVPLTQLPGEIVTNNATGVTLSGTFAGNGSGLTSLDANNLAAGTVAESRIAAAIARTNMVWLINGNSGTTPGSQFLGTTDNQPLELWVNNTRALRLEPTVNSLFRSNLVNLVGGSSVNYIAPGVYGSVIAGGGAANYMDVAYTNSVAADFSFLGGGSGNAIQVNAVDSTIGGGQDNTIQTNAFYSTIGGGYFNTIQPYASDSTIGGGAGNTIQTNAYCATIPGGYQNSATNSCFAAGTQAKADHDGAFVWADDTPTDFLSTRANEFAIRAGGGLRLQSGRGVALDLVNAPIITRGWDPFNSSAGANKDGLGRWGLFMEPANLVLGIASYGGAIASIACYNADGTRTNLMWVDTSGNLFTRGAVNPPSDREAKEQFTPVDAGAVLAKVATLPVMEWAYKGGDSARHLGPVAQDFKASFGLGTDDKHIATVDADGVALAAIQGLNEKVESGKQKAESRMEKLEAENAELKRRLERLEQKMSAKNGGAQ